jgi:hydrogenase nickel incorporation protein HypA/HybF
MGSGVSRLTIQPGPRIVSSCQKRESMHELSIAASIVESVTESLAAYPGARVKEVRLRVGVLAAVVEDSLKFCWEITTEGTPLAGSALVVNMIPVVLHCEACGRDAEIEGVHSFRCPSCGGLSGDLRQGRELEIDSIEIEDPEPEASGIAGPDRVEEQT